MFFKNKNKNIQNSQEDKSSLKKVALRTMQQDLNTVKESNTAANSTVIEMANRHKTERRENDLFADSAPSAPLASSILPRLAETEYASEKETAFSRKDSGEKNLQGYPDISSISISESEKNTDQKISSKVLNKIPFIKTDSKKIFALAAGICGILAVSIGAYFSIQYFLNKPESITPPEIIPPVAEEPIILENKFKFLDFDNTYDIDVSFTEFNGHNGSIKSILAEKISSKDLVVLEDEFIDIQISINGEFPASGRIMAGISETFPEEILMNFSDEYNLIAYKENGNARLGLIVKIENQAGISSLLSQSEKTFPEDLNNLYFDSTEMKEPAAEKFLDASYNNVDIRYKNFPNSSVSINYAIVDNRLLITTSKDSMLNLIDCVISEIEKKEGELLPDNSL